MPIPLACCKQRTARRQRTSTTRPPPKSPTTWRGERGRCLTQMRCDVCSRQAGRRFALVPAVPRRPHTYRHRLAADLSRVLWAVGSSISSSHRVNAMRLFTLRSLLRAISGMRSRRRSGHHWSRVNSPDATRDDEASG
jgi:hypothetical protein